MTEVGQHLPRAWERVVEEWRAGQLGRLAFIGLGRVLVALGPAYFALEVLQRSFT
jgi:hypothetical protein